MLSDSRDWLYQALRDVEVLMHLMALGAFRPRLGVPGGGACRGVLMHLMALGAFWRVWTMPRTGTSPVVLMHLMALGAFWPRVPKEV